MTESARSPATVRWVGDEGGEVVLLDQTRLPQEVVLIRCRTVEEIRAAIVRLAVRGAPAIGVAAAYGVCLAAVGGIDTVLAAADRLASSRPTAVNLFWALARMRRATEEWHAAEQRGSGAMLSEVRRREHAEQERLSEQKSPPAGSLDARLLAEARAIHAEDAACCTAIGRHGADLLAELPVGANLLTHCNAGALATGGDGTALAVIFELARRGRDPHVWVDETRPLLQGARLTAWELQQRRIRATLICDNMAAPLMRDGRVQAIVVGADRIAANGDAANKIGTYGLAVLAAAHDVPFYVAAPTSTIDWELENGAAIPIEQRHPDEVRTFRNAPAAPADIPVDNPAFDVTPARLIRAIVTECGAMPPGELRMLRHRLSRELDRPDRR